MLTSYLNALLSPFRSNMIDDTGPTYLTPTTGITSFYCQRRREANLPKPDEREALRRVHALHRTQVPADVVKAAHLLTDLFKAHMTSADHRKGIDLYHYKFLCNLIAHSDGPTPHLKGDNRYCTLRNEPTDLRRAKEYRAWHDLGDAITLFEAYYYPDEATSDPVC